jgi:hypothetical protein
MNLQAELQLGVENNLPLIDLWAKIKAFKEQGGQQSEALKILSALRENSQEENQEDIILELMDFVTGFCSPHMMIW